jgi:hypothetical protein
MISLRVCSVVARLLCCGAFSRLIMVCVLIFFSGESGAVSIGNNDFLLTGFFVVPSQDDKSNAIHSHTVLYSISQVIGNSF